MKKYILTLVAFNLSLFTYGQSAGIGEAFINDLFVEKNYDKAHSYFDEMVKNQLSVNSLKDTEEKIEKQVGGFKSIIEINSELNTYFFFTDFKNAKLDIKITINKSQKIVGFFFVPHREFKKVEILGEDLNIKSLGIELKGTLLLPEKSNKKKMLIFVHGSGPQDRDATIIENKPFKDIAEELYRRGIGSYRFDKRTLSNPESFGGTTNKTIDDEVTNDVLSIIDYFKNDLKFSQYEIILLGHSFGGYMLPRVANKTKNISKLIFLAGNSRPIDVLVLEQLEYLNKIDPADGLKVQLKKFKQQVGYLNSSNFSLNSPKEKLPFSLSAYYWKSLLDYKPLIDVKKIKVPILVLQGERDYQIKMEDYQLWKESLKLNKTAKFISYLNLNHLFMEGTGLSVPKEYSVKGNVNQDVIRDIEIFIKN
ncbi:MAG: alpha/beta fold hydrolase [Bacteroidota bacterium]